MFAIMYGTPLGGFGFLGPFSDHDSAVVYGNTETTFGAEEAPWWVVPLQKSGDCMDFHGKITVSED